MELMLPPSKGATGWLRLERGDLAARRYSVEISICPSPVCQCERVRLRCFPEQSPQASVPVCLEMDLEQSEIANFEELNSDPESITLAKAIANEISKADWNKLRSFYLGVKQYLTEHTDPDQIDADFPPDVLAGEASMVGYYEILPYAKPVEFTLGAQTWLLDDQHCVREKCSCQEAALSFFELRPSGQYSGVGSEPALCIRYAYDTGQIEPLSRAKDGRWSGQDFVDALREVLPELDSVLAKRQALLRRLYRRALSRKTIRLQAPKPGRNELCPCGSGKKYKKCCGA
jgi:SEC-C motif